MWKHKLHEFSHPTKCTKLLISTFKVIRVLTQWNFCVFKNVHFHHQGVKQSVPLQAWNGLEGSRKLRFPDYMTVTQDGCQPYATAAFTPRKCSLYSFLLEAESTPVAVGRILCQWKIPMTSPGIEPATFRFVTQHLNHCASAVPLIRDYLKYFCMIHNWYF